MPTIFDRPDNIRMLPRGTMSPASSLQKRALNAARSIAESSVEPAEATSAALDSRVGRALEERLKGDARFKGSSGVIQRPSGAVTQTARKLGGGFVNAGQKTLDLEPRIAEGEPTIRAPQLYQPNVSRGLPQYLTVGIGPVMKFVKEPVRLTFSGAAKASPASAIMKRQTALVSIRAARGRVKQFSSKTRASIRKLKMSRTPSERRRARQSAINAARARAKAAMDLRKAQIKEWAAANAKRALDRGDAQAANMWFNKLRSFETQAAGLQPPNPGNSESSTMIVMEGLGALGQTNAGASGSGSGGAFNQQNADALIQGGVSIVNNIVDNIFGGGQSPPPQTQVPADGSLPPTQTSSGSVATTIGISVAAVGSLAALSLIAYAITK